MAPGLILQIIMIIVGVFLFGAVILSLAKREMTEPFCLTWGLMAVCIILAGILLRPSEWYKYISPTGLVLLLLLGFCFLFGQYFMSIKVSELMRENMELSMQVSLLKHEKEEQDQIDEKRGKSAVEKEESDVA